MDRITDLSAVPDPGTVLDPAEFGLAPRLAGRQFPPRPVPAVTGNRLASADVRGSRYDDELPRARMRKAVR
jgi:hypothetical protein